MYIIYTYITHDRVMILEIYVVVCCGTKIQISIIIIDFDIID